MTMRWTAILIAVVFSCHDSSMNMEHVHGVPAGVTLRCGEFDGATGMCVGTDGKSYGCVEDSSGCSDNRYDCTEAQVFNHHTTDTVVIHTGS